MQIIRNGFEKQAEILDKRMTPNDYTVELIKEQCAEESYKIEVNGNKINVYSADDLGMYYGIGKLLHSADYKNGFCPRATDGFVTPQCDFRGIYFAIHFYNWYHMATDDELENYLEELLLWGYNTVIGILPIINSTDEDDMVFRAGIDKLHKIAVAAKRYKMRFGLIFCLNQGFKNAPEAANAQISFDLTYRGNLGRNLCPHKREAIEHMRGIWNAVFESFEDTGIDCLITWPYDEGGCGCEKCRPWGKNGYPYIIEIFNAELKKHFPKAEIIVSTWAFDMPVSEGEYEGLYEKLESELSFVDKLMIDSHFSFPQYPLNHGIIKPVINFPEISMWGLAPWSGFGANPLPERFQRIWDSSKHILSGGLPYSEGIYEDISKIQCVGYYWNKNAKWQSILSEYVSYEISPEVVDEVLEIFELIEKNHVLVAEDNEPVLQYAQKAAELARKADNKLCERARSAWRWRLIYIRAVLDQKRYSRYFETEDKNDKMRFVKLRHVSGNYLVDDDEAQALFQELQVLYRSVPFNHENHHTLPPLNGTKGIAVGPNGLTVG